MECMVANSQLITCTSPRTYEKVTLFANGTSNGSQSILHFHNAVITSGGKKMKRASCVTFNPPEQVPVGQNNRVNRMESLIVFHIAQLHEIAVEYVP